MLLPANRQHRVFVQGIKGILQVSRGSVGGEVCESDGRSGEESVEVLDSRFRSFPQDARPCCDDWDVRFPEDKASLLIIDPQQWKMSMFVSWATDISLAVSFFVVSCTRMASRRSHRLAWAQLTVKFYLTYHFILRNF